MKQVDPTEAVKQAKAAVEGLDEPYKMEAFKLVLNRLMAAPNEASAPAATASKSTRIKTARKAKSPTSAKRAEKKTASTLSLSVEQLKKLKAYFERFTIKGGEICTFVITNFIREEFPQKSITAPDIEYCYRQLISMKTTVPEIRDVERALNWLTAPSRKKEWLERFGDGYQVSNSGLIAFNALEKAGDK